MESSVLIFGHSSGGAHNAIAGAVKEGLEQAGISARQFDLHEFLTPLEQFFFAKGVFWFLNYLPNGHENGAWQPLRQSTWLARFLREWYPLNVGLAQQVFQQFQPSVVVTTHPFGAVIVQRLGLARRVPVLSIPVNYELHPYQLHRAITTYCLPHEVMRSDGERLRVPASRLAVTGVPAPSVYDTLLPREAVRRALNLPEEAPVVMVSQGVMGSGSKTVVLVQRLLKELPEATQFLVMTGRNTVVAQLLRSFQFPARVHIIDFVSNFHEYLRAADILVGKAGGSSSTAAFLAETALVIFSPNMFEVVSAQRFAQAGVAELTDGSVDQAVQAVKKLLNPDVRQLMTARARQFVIPNGRERVVQLVQGTFTKIPKASGNHEIYRS